MVRRKEVPRPPKHLSREAKGWWNRLLEEYDLADECLLLLESALEAFDRMREAQVLLKAEGLVVKDRFDQSRPHPAAAIEVAAKGVMLRNIKALGLDLEPIGPIGRPSGR